MKIIEFTVSIEVPDDETDKHWQELLSCMEECAAKKGYGLYDSHYEEDF